MYNKIQSNFNKASRSYEHVADTQQYIAKFLVNVLLTIKNFNPKTILDLGTGTGYIPELLLQNYKDSFYYLNDIAHEMLEFCKAKFSQYSRIHYLHGNMLQLDIPTFDLVVSNLALQWLDDLPSALQFFQSKSSEVFTFSTLLEGTFQEWYALLKKYQSVDTHLYPQAEKLIHFCNKIKKNNQRFDYWLMDIPLLFNNPTAFMHYLKFLGASTARYTIHCNTLKKLIKTENAPLTVHYKIFCGLFRKIKP